MSISESKQKNLVGRRVAEARKLLGIKQKELLAKLQLKGVTMGPSTLSLLEAQKRPASEYELRALAEILKVDVDWLLGKKE